MKGQGAIIGVGAMEYPPEWQGASEETHRPQRDQQGHDADLDLRPPGHPGRPVRRVPASGCTSCCSARTASTTRSSASLRIPYEPIRWANDIATTHDDEISKQARILELIHAYRVRGHMMADTDPLEYRQRSHPDLEVESHGLTLWDLDREFATGSFGGEGRRFMKLRHILGILRDSYCRTIGIEYMHIMDPEQRRWIQERVEQPHTQAAPRGAAADPAQAQPGRGVRDVPADQVRRPEAVQPRGRRDHDPADRRDLRGGRRGRPRRGHASAWPTAAGSTCWPTSSARSTPRSSASSRATSTRARSRAPAT